MSVDPVISRSLKLRKQILEPSEDGVTYEGLIDAFNVLYEECTAQKLKPTDYIHIVEFLDKFRSKIHNINRLRINVGDFDIIRLIGRGNFGDVKLAKEKSSGNVYALKIIKKERSSVFEEERDIMARATSPWLTKLDYAFQDASNLYLAMEFHAGGDLLSLLERVEQLDEKAVRFYTAEVALGIHDLHKMGYVHRDIKPENILIDRMGHLKLADFGNAGKLSMTGSVKKELVVGTPEYIAPEVLQCLQNKDGKSHGKECDYWSLGILAYEMFFGTTPFSDLDGNVVNTYSKIMSHEVTVTFPDDREVSEHFRSLVEGLLMPVSRRLGHNQLVRHKFFEEIDLSSIQNTAPPIVPQVKSMDDASNFDLIEDERHQEPDISALRPDKHFKNLPFVGFTFTSDKGKLKTLERKAEDSLVEDLKSKAEEVERLKLKNFQLEQQLDLTSQQESQLQRDSEVNEKYTQQLSKLEMENIDFKNQVETLKRTLEIEQQDRKSCEMKAVQFLKDIKEKWKKAEEERHEAIRSELMEAKAALADKDESLSTARLEAKSVRGDLEQVSKVKSQLKAKLKDYVERLERLAALNEQKSQTVARLEDENQNLRSAIQASKEQLDESKSIEGKVSALSQIIEQRDQILAERDAEIRIKKTEVESFSSKLKREKEVVVDLEAKLRAAKDELRQAKKELSDLQSDRLHEQDEQNGTVVQMKAELSDAISEIAGLREELEAAKSEAVEAKRTASEAKVKAIKELEKKHKAAVVVLEDGAKQKESDYKKKIKELEKVFEQLQAKIDELQAVKNLRASEKSDAQKEKLAEFAAKVQRQDSELVNARKSVSSARQEVASLETDNAQLKDQIKELEEKISELENAKESLEKTIVEKDKDAEINTDVLGEKLKLEREVRELKLDLRIEKRELEKKTSLVSYLREKDTKSREKITELETKVSEMESNLATLEQNKQTIEKEKAELESAAAKLENVKEDLAKVKNEKGDLTMELRKLKTDCSSLESTVEKLNSRIKELEQEAEKHGALQETNKTYKDLLVTLDQQITDVEEVNEKLQEQMAESEKQLQTVVGQLEQAQEEVKRGKIAVNEEKSAKLFAESKRKDLDNRILDLEKTMAQERDSYAKNINEYKELCSKLSATLEDITADNVKKEQVNVQTENVKSFLELENKQLKEEITEKISILQSSKEANFKLKEAMQEAIEKIKLKNDKIEELNVEMESINRMTGEKIARLEGTIVQQQKLIDFLHDKVSDLEGRKKTFAEKIFGSNKENRPQGHMAMGYKEVEDQLKQEKIKNRKLVDQLSRVRAEVVALKTNQMSTVNIPSKVLTQIDNKMMLGHNIPHRLASGPCKKTSSCPVCQKGINFMATCESCRDCGVNVHSDCAADLPNTCGLAPQLVGVLTKRDETYGRPRSKSEVRHGTLPVPPQNKPPKEGKAKVALKGDWADCHLVLTDSNYLDVFKDATKAIRIKQIALTLPQNRVSIQTTVSSHEVYHLNPTDRPYTFKLSVIPSGKPEQAIYFMTDNFAQKVEWVNKLEEVIKSAPSNLAPVSDSDLLQEQAKEFIAALPPDNEILSMCFVEDCLVIGTDTGLCIRLKGADNSSELRNVPGIDGPVMKIVYEPSIQMVLVVCGLPSSHEQPEQAQSGGRLVQVRSRLLVSGTLDLHWETVPDSPDNCHIFASHTTSKGQVYLCAANKFMVTIFEWSEKRGQFVFRNKFSTDKHTGAIFFTDNSVLVGTTKFYEIDLMNFSAEEFLGTSDPEIRRLLESPEFEGSEPRAVLPVPNSSELEYLLCFTRHVLFVDGYGQQTRKVMRFSRLPMEHFLLGRILVSSFSDRLQLLSLDLESGDSLAEDKVEIRASVPHLVGTVSSKVYYTTQGESAYNLVSLDVKKIQLK